MAPESFSSSVSIVSIQHFVAKILRYESVAGGGEAEVLQDLRFLADTWESS